MPSKGDGASSLPRYHLWLQATRGLTWATSPASERDIPTPLPCWTSLSSKLPPAPFVLSPTKKQKRKELGAVGWEASSTTLLTPCSSSTLQIWRIFSFAAVSTLSRGSGKEGQTAAAFLQKRAFAAYLSAEGQCPAPLRQADSISSVWHLHSALELCSYVNVRQSGDIVQIL